MSLSNYTVNKIIDAMRGIPFSYPSEVYFGLIVVSKGIWTPDYQYNLNDYVISGSPSNGRLYMCTTPGISGLSAPVWPTTGGGVVIDGTSEWTEQTSALVLGNVPEAYYPGYQRASVAADLSHFSGTQGFGSTVASSGTSMQTFNNGTLVFPIPLPPYDSGLIIGLAKFDSAVAGNLLDFSLSSIPTLTTSNPYVAPAAWSLNFGVYP